jgi:hypothetical protein
MENRVVARAVRLMMIVVMVAAVLAGVASAGLAQERVPVPDALCAALPAPGAAEACAAYNACIAADPAAYLVPQACDQALYDTLLAGCAAEGACAADILFSAAITQVAADYTFELFEPEAFHATLAGIAQAYTTADASLLDALVTSAFDGFQHRLLPYLAGLGHVAFGSAELALARFTTAVDTQFNTPLAFYSRGYLHAAQGRDDLASQDFYTFAALQGEDALVRYGLSAPAVTADEVLPDAQAFVLYPVARYGGGPVGSFVTYTFDGPALPVTISLSADETTLAVQGLAPESFGLPLPDVLFFTCAEATCTRTLALQPSYMGLSPSGSTLRITAEADFLQFEEAINYSEASTDVAGALLPADADDPRPAVTCPGGAYPLLGEGMAAIEIPGFAPVRIYAEPDASSALVAEVIQPMGEFVSDIQSVLTITGGVTCAEGGNWWPVTTADGLTGWVPDTAEGSYYSLMPADWYENDRPTVAELLALP